MEANYNQDELTLRMVAVDPSAATRIELIKAFAKSVGLLSDKETRASILPVLDALFYFNLKEKKAPTYQDIVNYLGGKCNTIVHEKTLRYHLTQLRKAKIIEDIRGRYIIKTSLTDSFWFRTKEILDNVANILAMIGKVEVER